MIFVTQELLFFSLNDYTTVAFERYVKYTGKEFKRFSEFSLIRQENGTAKTFKHLKELMQFIDTFELVRLANLIIVIDQYSFNEADKQQNNEIINELIVGYPEVKIVFLSYSSFDWINHFGWEPKHLRCKIENSSRWFCKKPVCNTDKPLCNIEFPYIHTLNFTDKYSYDLDLLIRGQSNLFDASNLRCLVKQIIFEKIRIRTNFPKNQCSRNDNFSLVVEEEIQQAYFNSYALYINGFRALPVISCKELNYIKALKVHNPDIQYNNHFKLIIRDYDLQFEDYQSESIQLKELRGISYSDKWERHLTNIWENFGANIQTWFVTRLDRKIDKDETSVPQIQNNAFKRCENNDVSRYGIILEGKKAYLRGLTKPLNGLYELHEINVVKESYDRINKEKSPGINNKRENDTDDSHSTPPYIFHIANNLLTRSQRYYSEKMYMLSALLAKEALEVLNGFHFMMMLKAIYIYSVAETSLVMDSLGANEDILADNTKKELENIKKIVQRICKNNPKAMDNVLGQIYNDIRHICRDKEQFKSADIALNEMVNLRQGTTWVDIKRKLNFSRP